VKRSVLVVLLLLGLPGCELFRRELPPWARPTPAAPSSDASDSEVSAPPESAEAPPESAEAPPESAEAAPEAVTPEFPAPPPPVAQPPALPPPVTAPPPPAAPPPVAATPPPTPATPVRPSPPPPAAPPAAAAPRAPLTANLPPAEARRLQDEAQRAIEETERLLRQLDGRLVSSKDLETLSLAQGLVEQARKALGGQEYERAANLAAKARTLAVDLSSRR
jgi:hypothetical protein